jgi:endoglucanase
VASLALAGGAVALGLTLGDAGSPSVDGTVTQCLRAARAAPAAATTPAGAATPTPPSTAAPAVFIRLNQVGYAGDCAKLALVMSQRPLDRAAFQVTDPSGRRVFVQGALGGSRGAWSSRWGYVYPLDFGSLRTPGRYVIDVGGVRSPAFSVGSAAHLYAPLAANAVTFFQAQRDGPDVIPGALGRQPSHLRDAHAAIYRQPAYSDLTLLGSLIPAGGSVNASGGWFDAGDYLKFVETASFSDTLMLWTLRDYGGGVAGRGPLRREARYGLDWLLRMWDQHRRVLYYQVGIGDGNGASVLGDHDIWRLPQVDDSSRARPGAPDYFVANRPIFPANSPGGPISPNLAGRVAAAFALCAQVFAASDRGFAERCLHAGTTIYSLANTNPRQLLSTSPHAYYGDGIWQDDMELGAIELYRAMRVLGDESPKLATGLASLSYLTSAARWADAYASSDANGQDTFNLYDVAPLAHYDLVGALRSPSAVRAMAVYQSVNISTDPNSLQQDLHDQLALAARVGQPDPFRLANVAGNTDTVPHALGVAIQARLYDLLTHRATFEGLAETQLDWVLGANAWGTSFVVGAGSLYPQCLADPIANLSGSLDGRSPLLLGATIDGPNDPVSLRDRGAPDGYRKCPANGADRFAPFNAAKIAYVDDVTSATTSEPADDFVALSLLAFAQAAQTQP